MKHIAVVMGGYSDEYKVSLKSGQLVWKSLDREEYCVYKVVIRDRYWYYEDEDKNTYPISKEDFSISLSGVHIKFDVCFNTIHGKPGENGELQAYWNMIGQKYTGCSFYASALTFNKKDTLAVLSKYHIPSARSFYLKKGEQRDLQNIINILGLPLFVKPNQSGSSLGISKVSAPEDLSPALDKAFLEDEEILVEQFLKGTEVSVGVTEYKGEIIVLGITEIISKNDFFDYEAKYEGASEEITPARLDAHTRQNVEELSKRAYKALGMSGFSRSEYIIVEGTPYMLEMNTNPGLSPSSILPQQAKTYGLSMADLFAYEIEKALNKNI
ncbi:MAG: D-alanine--D-alanine ligase [Bergeyella sp.]|nr:D-alanine--D-alanine ligase [Bergeyella sp.]